MALSCINKLIKFFQHVPLYSSPGIELVKDLVGPTLALLNLLIKNAILFNSFRIKKNLVVMALNGVNF